MAKDQEQIVELTTKEQTVLAITAQNDRDILIKIQKFQEILNQEPAAENLDKTPDGQAKTVIISAIETTLDELFFGQWSTENFKWSAIANEVQGSLELVVIHPITGREIRRVGSGSVVITVDSLSQEEKNKMTKQERNLYALNPENKKPNALDLSFPKLKAECLKNAAQSLGRAFGRDLNRKKSDRYKPLIAGDIALPTIGEELLQKLLTPENKEEAKKVVENLKIDTAQKEQIKKAHGL